MKTILGLLVFVTVLLAGEASADFWDQGFRIAYARPELSYYAGSHWVPLAYGSPCLFPGRYCGNGPATGRVYYREFPAGAPPIGASYWALSINNEPAFSDDDPLTGNPGVPNRTHPLYYYTSNYWNYYPEAFDVITDTAAGENYPRAHLIVRHQGGDGISHDGNGAAGIPFVAIGAWDGRGNGGPIGEIYGTGKYKVRFTARIYDYVMPDPGGGLWFFIQAFAEWGGVMHAVQLNLKHIGVGTDHSSNTSAGIHFPWNWPVVQSMYFPGADFAQFDSEDLNHGLSSSWHCGFSVPQMNSTGVDYQFDIDLEKLFECASARNLFTDQIPPASQGALSIVGINWGNEMYGTNGGLWTAVHDMSMY